MKYSILIELVTKIVKEFKGDSTIPLTYEEKVDLTVHVRDLIMRDKQ